MKKPIIRKLLWIVRLLLVGVFVANTIRFRLFGRVVAIAQVEIDSVSHRVLLRERCISSIDTYLILRSRNPEYEYWTELRRSWRTVATSQRYSQDSTSYDNPRIDTADSSGATVSLDPRLPHPSNHRFEWVTNHK